MTLPPYIDFGVVISTPPPVVSTGADLLTVVLDGDAAKLDALVERVLNVPMKGTKSQDQYRAIGSTVILQLGSVGEIRSGPPFDQAGSARETQASIWVPVVAGHQMGPVFMAERFGIFCPYLFVDNPMSLVGGREVFGYPKSGGRFAPADASGDDITVRVFGGDFGPSNTAQWHPLLRVRKDTLNAGPPGQVISGAAAIVKALTPALLSAPPLDGILPDPAATTAFLSELQAGRMSQVFLKQFRDVADGQRACYQQVVEAPVQTANTDLQLTGAPWTVTVDPLDSHPLTAELGLVTQTTLRAYRTAMDFTVATGAVMT